MIKWTTVCLVALALLGLLCVAQSQRYGQQTRDPSRGNQQKLREQQRNPNQQSKQTFEVFTWTYPDDEVEPTAPQVDVELNPPEPAVTVTATCGETNVEVMVMKDLFNNGQIISTNDLKLGGCNYFREDATSITFEPQLHECGSTSEVSIIKTLNIFDYE